MTEEKPVYQGFTQIGGHDAVRLIEEALKTSDLDENAYGRVTWMWQNEVLFLTVWGFYGEWMDKQPLIEIGEEHGFFIYFTKVS